MNRVASLFRGFADFLTAMMESRQMILQLTQRDFKANYLGSYLSFVWAFIQPCVIMTIFYFVFQVGFKAGPVEGHPFILWFMAGIVPWFFFSDALMNGTNSILNYSFLVKKMVFRVSVLPVIKILSALFVHLFFLALLFGIFLWYGYTPTVYHLQILYYLIANLILLIGLSWITSSIVVFVKDIGQIISVLVQMGLWMTPIMWNYKTVPLEYHNLLKLNPAFYIVEGYRECFLYQEWFWTYGSRMAYFWGITGILFIAGAVIFLKLRPHFADVL
jgi:lipopolysaccharide transport system permease protein/teichoic acid transport system permease protein